MLNKGKKYVFDDARFFQFFYPISWKSMIVTDNDDNNRDDDYNDDDDDDEKFHQTKSESC